MAGKLDEFNTYREKMNAKILETGDLNIKRFFNIDFNVYQDGALDKKTKELLGLVASTVLRCNDCISYHMKTSAESGVSDKEFYEELQKALKVINKNVFCCRNVRKKLIPKKLIQKYRINNLWIYNLRNGWRLLYSVVTPNKVEVLALILDWMNHKEYERLFKF